MCDSSYANEVVCPSGVNRVEVVTLTSMDDIIIVEVDKTKINVENVNSYMTYLQAMFPDNRIILSLDGVRVQIKHKDILV